MVMASNDDFYEDEDAPVSNPLPPPPRPPPRKEKISKTTAQDAHFSNLSNDDFRKMVMNTPRRNDDRNKPKGRGPHRHEEEGDAKDGGAKHGSKKNRPKFKEEEKEVEAEEPKYRDRAKERREEVNPDYESTTTELGGLNAVAPPGVDLNIADAHRISIENSKFLGGDVEHTHLVKGLDYALLQKVRSEIGKGNEDEDEEEGDGTKRRDKIHEKVNIRTTSAKAVYQWIVKQQRISKVNEMFLPGRTAFVFDMDEEFRHEIPTTVHRSRADCPPPEEAVNASVDSNVLERISKIMSYLRLGSSGKVLKKKKRKDEENGHVTMKGGILPSSVVMEEGGPEDDNNRQTAHPSSGRQGTASAKDTREPRESLPPPPPRETTAANVPQPPPPSDDDIFADVGTDYEPTRRIEPGSPVSEDMEESPRRPEEAGSYFEEAPPLPPEEALPPPPPSGDWLHQGLEGYHQEGAYPGPQLPQYGEWQEYPQVPHDMYGSAAAATWPAEVYPPPQQPYAYAVEPPPPGDEGMTQEDKDKGLGSVFKRDDQRLQSMRETDAREKDPNFISESYSECYPGYQEYRGEVVESDDEEDLTKMDLGAKAKKGLHAWDFATEEEWSQYNEKKEAMPKAAFQFGVKMKDGRRTGKLHTNKEQKLNNELNKINQILKKRKEDERGWDGGDGYEKRVKV